MGHRAFARATLAPSSLACGLLLGAAALFASTEARAQSKIDNLGARLRYPPPSDTSDDFRVRTNAALALGASNDDAAVPHLCKGLSDPNETVRLAVAAAMKKLARPVAADCIRARVPNENSASVKAQLKQAITFLEGGGTFVPRDVPNAKYYVALEINNKTARTQSEIEAVVATAIRQKLDDLDYQLAPLKETSAAAKTVLKKRKMRGYYLAVTVSGLDSNGGSVSAKINVAVASYPGRDIKGAFDSRGGIGGTGRGSEDMLLESLAQSAAQKFSDNVEAFK